METEFQEQKHSNNTQEVHTQQYQKLPQINFGINNNNKSTDTKSDRKEYSKTIDNNNNYRSEKESFNLMTGLNVERNIRMDFEEEIQLIANRIAMLNQQAEREAKKIQNHQQKALKLYLIKKQIEIDREQLNQMKQKQQNYKDDYLEQASKNKKIQIEFLKQAKENIISKRIQEAQIVKQQDREIDDKIRQNQNKLKEDNLEKYLKIKNDEIQKQINLHFLSQQRTNKFKHQLISRINEEKFKNNDYENQKKKLENVEMAMIENLARTRHLQKVVKDKVQLVERLPVQSIEKEYPDVVGVFKNLNTKKHSYSINDSLTPSTHKNKFKSLASSPKKSFQLYRNIHNDSYIQQINETFDQPNNKKKIFQTLENEKSSLINDKSRDVFELKTGDTIECSNNKNEEEGENSKLYRHYQSFMTQRKTSMKRRVNFQYLKYQKRVNTLEQ